MRRRCSVPGCANWSNGSRAVCSGHRSRINRHGDVLADIPLGQGLAHYFESKNGWFCEHDNPVLDGMGVCVDCARKPHTVTLEHLARVR